jgi:hypothetical protein
VSRKVREALVILTVPRRVITVLVPVVYLLHVLSSWPLWLWLAPSLIGRGSDSLRLVRPEKENTSKRPLLMQHISTTTASPTRHDQLLPLPASFPLCLCSRYPVIQLQSTDSPVGHP